MVLDEPDAATIIDWLFGDNHPHFHLHETTFAPFVRDSNLLGFGLFQQ